MIQWIVLSLWDVLSLAVAFGPLGLLIIRWERHDRRHASRALERDEPGPQRSGRETAIRFMAGVAMFFFCGAIAAEMYDTRHALAVELGRNAPF
ncbi:hypothetical protein [Nitratireductor rhodophyticola]